MQATTNHAYTRILAMLAGILLVGLVSLTASRAVFSATTDNSGNQVSAGSVVLTDDDSGSVLFNVSDMVPGQSEARCIEVTYSGTIADPGGVVVYSGGLTDSGSLASELNLTIEEGTGGTFGDCAGFTGSGVESGTLAAFATDHTDYATGVGAWDPASTPESRTYRITLELDSDADNTVQGESVTDLAFVWEVES